MNWEALFLTARLAAITSGLLLVFGLPLAWWLAHSRWRGRPILEAIVALPLVLPPTVLGFYILIFIGPNGVFGKWVELIFHSRLPFSFTGLLIASVVYSLPFALQPFLVAFRLVDPVLLEAASVDGANRWQIFRWIALPLAWPGLLAGVVLSFAHTIGEFGVALMVGGNIAGRTQTISMAIYDDVQALRYHEALLSSLGLLGFSLIVLTAVAVLQKRYSARNAGRFLEAGK